MADGKIILGIRRVSQTIVYNLARVVVLIPFFIIFRVHISWSRDYRKIRGAYVLFGQHQLAWDPVLITLGGRHAPHWVATDAIFRKKGLGWVMKNLAACIPTTKNMSDMETIKMIRIYAALGARIGIFPEGQQTWDGKGLPPVPGTAKLLRFLKMPVVFVYSEGAYLTKARWNWGHNRRPVYLRYEVGISADEIATMKLSEIEERLKTYLDYDEYAVQKEKMVPLSGEKRAENMELTLFTCPRCRAMGTLESRENRLSCSACDFYVDVDRYGLFDWGEGEKYFEFMHHWNDWQQKNLLEVARNALNAQREEPFFDDDQVWLRTGHRRRPLARVAHGRARFYQDRMVFLSADGEEHIFYIKDVTGLNVFKQHFLEFHHQHRLYRLDFESKSVSGYKWMCLFYILLELRKKETSAS
ncbi:MAG: 1-acyl-sn-glycerol-3-phosphate acyltransferase [Spirochaetales bacterium]|nr:1-acyl-sn-glycerol-3-phosphate acyltransferase [Spirochaetales bacterium]